MKNSRRDITSRICLMLALLLFSCAHSRTEIVEYKVYYDSAKEKLNVEGKTVDGDETGEWTFYSTDGTITQTGTFSFGLQEGEWKYKIEGIDSIINWRQIDTCNFNFSLPVTFNYRSKSSDSTNLNFVDSINHILFSIIMLKECDSLSTEKFYDSTLTSLKEQCNILGSKSTRSNMKCGVIYFDEYLLQRADYEHEINEFMTYKGIGDGKMLLVVVVGRHQNQSFLRLINNEVFYHVKYGFERVSFSYDEIKPNDIKQ